MTTREGAVVDEAHGPAKNAASRVQRRKDGTATPQAGAPGNLLRLQRLAGNRAAVSVIQRDDDDLVQAPEKPPKPPRLGQHRRNAPLNQPFVQPPPVPPRPPRLGGHRGTGESSVEKPPPVPPRPPQLGQHRRGAPLTQTGPTPQLGGHRRNAPITQPLQPGGSRGGPSYDELLEGVNLGQDRSKLTKRSQYTDIMAEYVSTAQLRAAQIRKAADTLGYDYISLRDLETESKSLASAPPTTNKKVLEDRMKLLTAYKVIVGENFIGKKPTTFKGASSDFDVNWEKSRADSAMWAGRAFRAREEVEEERVNVEMLWSDFQEADHVDPLKAGAKQAAEAKLSLDRIEVLRKQMKDRVEYLVNIKRVQGAGGKICDAVKTGIMSFGTTLLTLGIVAVEKEHNPVFYRGAGWTFHGDMPTTLFEKRADLLTADGKSDKKLKDLKDKLPVASREEKDKRFVVMENLGGKIKSIKSLLAQRQGGANTLDWMSAILWFIGDGLLQSLMAVGSRIAIWITGLNILLNLINVPAHGALTPVIAILTALALAITYIRMAMAAAKLAITAARAAVDGLNYALTSDPRMKQALKGRAIRSGVGLIGDSLQLGGFAVVLGGDAIKEGLGMSQAFHGSNNAFNPLTDIHNVQQVHSDVLSQTNDVSLLSGTYWEGTGIFGAGVVGILTGADAVPAIGEAVSDTNDLNVYGEKPYLGGSNQSSQGFQHHDMGKGRPSGTGPTPPPRPPRFGGPQGSVPGWMQEGKERETEMKGERAGYLAKQANTKVAASQSSMSEPMAKVGDAADKAQQVTGMMDKVKAFFSRESKKKDPDVPKDQIPEQQQEADDNQQSAKGFAEVLQESVSALGMYAA